MAVLEKINIYQRVFLFSFTMAALWWLVELASFHTVEYVINNPKVIYNTFAKRQAVWIMTGSLVGFFIFKTSKK
mgnify:FL=1|tara:strand:+ start:181 stop:402 length:222 start_codon:yes stop_codon:yes gene_type:complete